MPFLLSLAWRDLRASGRGLWVFCVCLALGVALVAATGGLYRQVQDALLADTRALAGGDLEVAARQPLPPEVWDWLAASGTVSLVTELDTMLATAAGELELVELVSVDDAYPLYGELTLVPDRPLREITGRVNGTWGVAVDAVLVDRLGLTLGDRVEIGHLSLEVRGVIAGQPDRRLSADWRGVPVMIAADALAATGLVVPASRIEYEYRLRTVADPERWRDDFFSAFPDGDWEVRTFAERSERIAERLGQTASALVIVAFATLFVGGLGVFNSIQAYLRSKRHTVATLRALGLRDRRLATVYLLQVGMLAAGACLAGAAAGIVLALAGATLAETEMAVTTAASSVFGPALVALLFGLVTAFTFSFPAIGRTLSVPPAALFRNLAGAPAVTPGGWRAATGAGAVVVAGLVLLLTPDAALAVAFVAAVLALLALLELVVRGLRRQALALSDHPQVRRRFALRLALANLHRPGGSLRPALLSLGTALTLVVACTTVVTALIHALRDTIPADAPALVLYDIGADQRDAVVARLRANGLPRVEVAPLVQGRLARVNGEALAASADAERRREARDEHKLTYPAGNIDGVSMVRGDWWPAAAAAGVSGLSHPAHPASAAGTPARPAVVMEDREADQLDLEVGDELTFVIEDRELTAELTGVYRQRGLQTRFWFEGILSSGALDPFISRYVGAAFGDDRAALEAQRDIAEMAPNVVSVRTATLLETARGLLGKAVAGLAAVGLVALSVSLLVLASVVASSRERQVYDATVLHAVGARLESIRRSLTAEHLLLAAVISLFGLTFGAVIAVPLLVYQLRLPLDFPLWPPVLAATGVSTACLGLGARYLLRRLSVQPARLLREGA